MDTSSEKLFTLEELSYYNGSENRPTYVAVDGNVYDVSLMSSWKGGTHFSLLAGQDLTNQFRGCHEGALPILNSLPRVGKLVN